MEQIEMSVVSRKNKMFSIIESLLFASGEPLKIKHISNILGSNVNLIGDVLEDMNKLYEDEARGIKLIKIEDSYQLVTKPDNSQYLQKLLNVNSKHSLSQAALETLSIIAYKQPVTRIEIEEIRGVKCDKAVTNLIEKDLIKECGRKDVPGRPILYATSDEFLKHFGLESLDKLPNLDKFTAELEDSYEKEEI
ncbi:SMC-Scp complex subunit ScpB [Haloimpatiens sp. FM7315]|uniref:SMC-Scp complex subunit ScpB n=1 Tax=Haloimpatiens sp. FM7315 TaxID=3298609 RepID=UPI0035A35876